ncbi:hypothetical protein E2C01_073451 [Portunus trituberculatus]|uniref:Uncharacterized protein n=1 Tax=Portunus trituberculatus TaxID=210409 RepID=A0A5B7I5E0_PORTR|nr:hypothetical protein [Portunus trituberculatus]
MGHHNAQSSYLATRVSTWEVARHYAGPSNKRSVTHEYSVVVEKKEIIVCKVTFCSIRGTSKKRIENVIAKVGSTGGAPVDQRGTARSANKTPDDVEQLVKDNILSLSTCSSHY